MRGEHDIGMWLDEFRQGSSPHARGTRTNWSTISASTRIIPACAGNTVAKIEYEALAWDHPRMRGEHFLSNEVNSFSEGSSPHARGTHIPSYANKDELGIIPACAGNTIYCVCLSCCTRDHPRMRGEHTTYITKINIKQGSSPHARGTRTGNNIYPTLQGIIPACAGNTISVG